MGRVKIYGLYIVTYFICFKEREDLKCQITI